MTASTGCWLASRISGKPEDCRSAIAALESCLLELEQKKPSARSPGVLCTPLYKSLLIKIKGPGPPHQASPPGLGSHNDGDMQRSEGEFLQMIDSRCSQNQGRLAQVSFQVRDPALQHGFLPNKTRAPGVQQEPANDGPQRCSGLRVYCPNDFWGVISSATINTGGF